MDFFLHCGWGKPTQSGMEMWELPAQSPQGAAAGLGGGALAPALLHKARSFFQCVLSGVEAQGEPVLPAPVGCLGGLVRLGRG